MTKTQRAPIRDYLLMGFVYFFTVVVSIGTAWFLPIASPLYKAAIADGLATLLVFAFSVYFNNSSMYDPYWSAAPVVLVAYWALTAEAFTARNFLILLLVTTWSARLTFNFLRRWQGMHHEDWRYADYRITAKKLYWPLSFFGFHFFPTAIVFAASVPMYFAMNSDTGFNFLDAAAAAVTLSAIIVEAVADKQMRRYILAGDPTGDTFKKGLWAYSRHPNYFGEVLFWWGLYLFVVAADSPRWWTLFGPALVTALFAGISLPLIETRMKKRHPDYPKIQKEISILIPWFPKTGKTIPAESDSGTSSDDV